MLGRKLHMADALYVVGTLAFFALMLAYVRGCERLGDRKDNEGPLP